MQARRTPALMSPLLRWALARARRGEVNTQTVVIIIIAVIGGMILLSCVAVIALMLPAYRQAGLTARQAAQSAQGQNNLKQIGLALHNYHDVHLQFPPSGIYGEDGTAYHSWQTMLLPYVDQAPLHSQINFDRPWNDPDNTRLLTTVIPTYLNPSISDLELQTPDFAISHYAGSSQLFLPNGTTRFRDITDGSANTMLAGEVAAGFKPWGDPSNVRDLATGLSITPNTFSGPVPQNGTQILMADGSVRTIQNSIDPNTLNALATPNGAEVVGEY